MANREHKPYPTTRKSSPCSPTALCNPGEVSRAFLMVIGFLVCEPILSMILKRRAEALVPRFLAVVDAAVVVCCFDRIR